MPPPLPPTKGQVASWVAQGIISPEQGEALRAREHTAPMGRTRFLGPAPHLASTGPAFAGIAGAIVVAATCILIDTLVANKTKLDPGDLLTWIPSGFAILMGVAALVTHGRLQRVLTAAALSLPCLLTALHPQPPQWMFAVAPAAASLTLVLRLDAPTRVVLAIPALVGIIIVSMGLLEASDQQSIITAVTGVAYLFAVAFAVPFESGWRRVPFAAHALAGIALVVLAGMAIPNTFSVGPMETSPGAVLLGTAAVIGYPILIWLLWTRDAARDYQLPTLPALVTLRRRPGMPG